MNGRNLFFRKSHKSMETLSRFLMNNAEAILNFWIVAGCIWSVIVLFAIYSCLSGEQGIDRLTWLIVIMVIPLFGVIFYAGHSYRSVKREDAEAAKLPEFR